MQGVKKVTAIPGRSIHTEKLIEFLKFGKPGDILSDEVLSKEIGMPTRPNGKGYSYLASAIKYVALNHDVIWLRQRGESTIKCLDASETEIVGDTIVNGIHSRSRKAARVYAEAIKKVQDPAEYPRLNAKMSQVGALLQFSVKDKVRELMQPLNTNQPTKELLAGIR